MRAAGADEERKYGVCRRRRFAPFEENLAGACHIEAAEGER